MTDAPPHEPEPFTGYTKNSVIDAAYRVDPAIIYSIVPIYDLDAVNSWRTLSSWTGGKIFTPDSPDAVARDFLIAINDIRDNPNFPPPPEPQSVPEPNLILGLFTLGFWRIFYSNSF